MKEEEGLIVTPDAVALTTKLDWVLNWPRKSSLWYLLFATACCGIELMQAGGPRTDMDRFGMVFRASPRQADLLLVAGAVTYKMAERVKLLYEQMPEPRYVLAMGACACSGGLFRRSYSVVKGIDRFLPVDVYVPGCAPRPEALLNGMMRMQDLMMRDRWLERRRMSAPELHLKRNV